MMKAIWYYLNILDDPQTDNDERWKWIVKFPDF